jgi:hypothetical protein
MRTHTHQMRQFEFVDRLVAHNHRQHTTEIAYHTRTRTRTLTTTRGTRTRTPERVEVGVVGVVG